jgi:hypothetical protein
MFCLFCSPADEEQPLFTSRRLSCFTILCGPLSKEVASTGKQDGFPSPVTHMCSHTVPSESRNKRVMSECKNSQSREWTYEVATTANDSEKTPRMAEMNDPAPRIDLLFS